MKGWLFLLAAGALDGGDEAARLILYHVQENPRLLVEDVTVNGRLCAERYGAADCGYPVRVNIAQNGGHVEFTASSDGVKPLSVRVPLSQVPGLDIQSTEVYGHYRPERLVVVEVKFGEPNNCYINDEGRPRLSVYLEDAGPAVHVTTYLDCEIVTEQIVGVSDAGTVTTR